MVRKLKNSRVIKLTFYLLCPFLVGATLQAQTNPLPFLQQPLVPSSVPPASGSFNLTLTGTGFVADSTVYWNGQALLTTLLNHSMLTATVPSSLVSVPTTAYVTVSNPAPGGGTSNVIPFSIGIAADSVTFTPLGTDLGFPGTSNLVTGDFNGDGKLDLATTNLNNNNSNSVCILLGRGDGSFQTPACYTGTQLWAAPVAADFNGDGKLDLAVPDSFGNTIVIFLGNGDGTLQPPKTFPVGPDPVAVVAGDFNGDGKLDVAVANVGNMAGANSTPGSVSVLLGNGDGTFRSPVNFAASTFVEGITIGDFNGDGNLDLATVNLGLDGVSSSVCVLLGKGNGDFQDPVCFSTGTQNWQSPIAADFNGDGKLDLAIAASNNGYNAVTLFLGNGDGTFQTGIDYAVGVEPVSLAVADFATNDKLDLAVSNAVSQDFSLLLGIGSGSFQNAVDYPQGTGSLGVPGSIVAGDFNQDGRPDVALALTDGSTNSLQISLRGPFPVATTDVSSVTLSSGARGQSSTPYYVSLTNSGNASLSLSNISVGGADPTEFAQFNTCSATIPVGGTCVVRVIFTPNALGTQSASLRFTDNAPGSPQTVSFLGIGDFSVTPASATAVTITPGQTAKYKVQVAPERGFNQTVVLSCSGAPVQSPCSLSPNSISFRGSAVIATVTVTTSSGSAALVENPATRHFRFNRPALGGLLGVTLLMGIAGWPEKRRRMTCLIAGLVALALILTISACGGGNGNNGTTGGGGGSSGGGGTSGTPAGTYTLTVTGSYQSNGLILTHNANLTLIVQ